MADKLKGKRHSEPTRCGSERQQDSECQNKNVGRRSIQDLQRLNQIQERERKNLKREQDKLKQEYMKGRQGLSPSVDSYLDNQLGKRTGQRQKEYLLIAKRVDAQKRAILDPVGFAREEDDLECPPYLVDGAERNGSTTH